MSTVEAMKQKLRDGEVVEPKLTDEQKRELIKEWNRRQSMVCSPTPERRIHRYMRVWNRLRRAYRG